MYRTVGLASKAYYQYENKIPSLTPTTQKNGANPIFKIFPVGQGLQIFISVFIIWKQLFLLHNRCVSIYSWRAKKAIA